MELISQATNEELLFGPPVYYLDNYIEGDNSKVELNRFIAFAKNINPIEELENFGREELFHKLNFAKIQY